MKEDVLHVVDKLQRQTRYQAAFTSAFGDDVVTPERMGLALEQFMLTILSGGDSKFDDLLQCLKAPVVHIRGRVRKVAKRWNFKLSLVGGKTRNMPQAKVC